MRKLVHFLIVVSLGLILNGCSEWGDDVESAGGTGDDTAMENNTPSVSTTAIVWKPISEGDRNLVVLLPTSFGSPEVGIYSTSKVLVETGRYVGRTNGNRATYRFSKPGANYDSPALLMVGSTYYYIKSTKSRYN